MKLHIDEKYIYLAAIVLLAAFFAFVLVSGCVDRETKDVVVVEKFTASVPCGYGSSTGYWILGSDGVAYILANSCSSNDFPADYGLWSIIQPGDVVRIHV